MKISICSDLHLEFGPINMRNEDNADVLILSGDILIAKVLEASQESPRYKEKQMYMDFFKQCSTEFETVIYVAGNHEFYHGEWNGSLRTLKEISFEYPNIHFLENETLTYVNDVKFIGCSLWTDMNKQDPTTMYDVRNYMNDFRQIKYDGAGIYRKLIPEDVVERHLKSKQYILDILANVQPNQKVVIVGHHAPSKLSTHPRYADDFTINGAYSSDLSDLILNNPNIKLWTHGHTHEPFDYMIGSTRIVANPRGYIGYEDLADHFRLKTVEI